jgi:hypothetical protein
VRVLERAASTPPETLIPDAAITRLDCGVPFTWSSPEQAFYRGRTLQAVSPDADGPATRDSVTPCIRSVVERLPGGAVRSTTKKVNDDPSMGDIETLMSAWVARKPRLTTRGGTSPEAVGLRHIPLMGME